MNIERITQNGQEIALINSDTPIITDLNSALDLIATVAFEHGCRRIALNKAAVTEEFFKLSTRLAGEILQKFINYSVKFAIYGDYSGYTSKPLKDFIFESNRGRDIFFVASAEEAVEKLANA